jgi:hypothetical protein
MLEGGGSLKNAPIVVVEAFVISLAYSKYIFWDSHTLSCGDKLLPRNNTIEGALFHLTQCHTVVSIWDSKRVSTNIGSTRDKI